MGIKKYKPTSAARRLMTVSDFADITKDSPEKGLTEPLKRSDIDGLVNYFAAQQPKAVVYMKLPCAEAAETE